MSRVLIVDDSRTQTKQLQLMLRASGFESSTAQDGEQALEMLKSERFDVVLTDVLMPKMSGYELCRAIKADPRLQGVPVILLTALHEAEDMIKGLAAGADNFITKPFDAERLIARIKNALTARDGADNVVHFNHKRFEIDLPRQQVLSFLVSTFEEYTLARERERETHARINRELAEKNRELAEGNARLVRAVQQMLIPSSAPKDVPGLEISFGHHPAVDLGGDWLHFLHDPQRKELLVLIGDVTGHGVTPALVTAAVHSFFLTLRTMLHARIDGELDLDSVSMLRGLDRVIGEIGRGSVGLSMLASRIEYEKRTLSLTNAGHQPPYLMRKGDHPRAISCPGTLIGFGERERYGTKIIELQAGDLLVWCTKGLLESCDPRDRIVGERRLLGWIHEAAERPIDEVRDHVMASLLKFLGNKTLSDDLALIVARLT